MSRKSNEPTRVLGALRLVALLAAFGLLCLPAAGAAADKRAGRCTATAKALFTACGFDVKDNWWVESAKCINVADDGERADCSTDAAQARKESDRECLAQLSWRLEACDALGEERYDPDFDPLLFDSDFAHLTHPNPYYPLRVGNRWEYTSADETNTVEVLDETKLINGLRCIVVHDVVFSHGELKEDTDDWFAHAKDGTVWYCGEETKSYGSFAGDAPRLPELVSIDGSFKAGRDGSKAGIIFLADPEPGDTYLEEFALGEAEDMTEILSTSYSFGHSAELDEMVPAALAQALCSGDCVVTRNISLLEPGVEERKYYAAGIGVFLEVEPEDGVVVRLTACNVDPRCVTLPQP